MAMATAPFEILLIEDNPADVRRMVEALKDARVPKRRQVARAGVEALQMLRDGAGSVPRPDLILLDFNLPRKDGREVLAEIKHDDALRAIPVVVLTTSQSEQDIAHAYRLHANAFITKPVEIDHFFEVIRSLEHFWLGVATLTRP
jgi:CheY-like chemotaxis protein